MDACLARLPPGVPVCSLGEAPGAPGRWLLSRCTPGHAPVLVELPAAWEGGQQTQQQTPPQSLQVRQPAHLARTCQACMRA
jgi:hypothetical protein